MAAWRTARSVLADAAVEIARHHHVEQHEIGRKRARRPGRGGRWRPRRSRRRRSSSSDQRISRRMSAWSSMTRMRGMGDAADLPGLSAAAPKASPGGHRVIALAHQVDAAGQLLDPGDELLHRGGRHRRAPCCGTIMSIGRRAAPSAPTGAGSCSTPCSGGGRPHARHVAGQRGHGLLGVDAADDGDAEIAREEDAAGTGRRTGSCLPECMKCAGSAISSLAPMADAHARVGDADHAAVVLPGLQKCGTKRSHSARCRPSRGRGGHPAIERGDDVRVGMRGEDGGELLGREARVIAR